MHPIKIYVSRILLSDGSYVHDVDIMQDDQHVELKAVSEADAHKLAEALQAAIVQHTVDQLELFTW